MFPVIYSDTSYKRVVIIGGGAAGRPLYLSILLRSYSYKCLIMKVTLVQLNVQEF